MRKSLLLSLSLLIPLLFGEASSAQESETNYIVSRTNLDSSGSSYIDAVQYYDDLGFPTESVQKGVTPSGGNLLSLRTYDNRGRESRSYLPVPAQSGTSYISPLSFPAVASEYHDDDSVPYSETSYESSPIGRVSSAAGPGEDWAGHAVNTRYAANTVSGDHSCLRYIVLPEGSLCDDGPFPEGSLRVKDVLDEDERRTIIFEDIYGRTVLVRKVCNGDYLDTYTVYDGYGLVRYLLQPGYQTSHSETADAFYYEYDVLGRVTLSRVPGCSPVRYWYDALGRQIFTQDGVQAGAGTWTFHLFDNRKREVLSGICSKTASDETAVASSAVSVGYSSDEGICGTGYSASGLSLPGAILLTATYYDTYDFLSRSGFTDRNRFPAPSSGSAVQWNGLVTGTVTGVFGDSAVIRSAVYYDAKGRPVKTVETHIMGGCSTETVSYTYTDKPSSRTVVRPWQYGSTVTELYSFSYDGADRLTEITHRIGSGGPHAILRRTYDDFGRTQTETFEGQSATRRTYGYDIRSNPLVISSGVFSEQLTYNDVSGATPLYGGDISSASWRSGVGATPRMYRYSYDGAGRLVAAEYAEGNGGSVNTGRYDEKVTGYDANGNPRTIVRKGPLRGGGYGIIDSLTVTRSGNRLTKVTDLAGNQAPYDSPADYSDGADLQEEFSYDANGNLLSDLDRGITIEYNALNLPSYVENDSESYSIACSGTGAKLSVVEDGSGETTCYVGDAVYEDDNLSRVLIPGGYVTLSGSSPTYHYYQKDHLGSNRMVTSASGTVEQVVDYYPFGGEYYGGTSPSFQSYKFTGKEQERSIWPFVYDFGARRYDASLASWLSVDPLAGNYPELSPYAYCAGNPVNLVDPDGKDIIIVYYVNDSQRTFRYTGKEKTVPENEYVRSVIDAYKFNKENWENAGFEDDSPSTQLVENSNYSVYVMEDYNDSPHYKQDNGGIPRIIWNAYMGLKSDNGVVSSPASILAHEADHAIDDLTDAKAHSERRGQSNDQYDNEEEKRVITGSEQKTALANGEIKRGQVTRTNHNGYTVFTIGPTSNIIDRQATKYYNRTHKTH